MRRPKNNESGHASTVVAIIALVGATLALAYFATHFNGDATEVGETTAEEMGRAAVALKDASDDAITTARVKTAFAVSKTVSALAIDVDTEGGSVTLIGTVPSRDVKAAALRLAGDTAGVDEVIDQLEIDGPLRPCADTSEGTFPRSPRVPEPDEIVVLAVREALESSGAFDLETIGIQVRSGLVELSGTVRSEAEKQLAEMLAGSTEGVVGVINDLEFS